MIIVFILLSANTCPCYAFTMFTQLSSSFIDAKIEKQDRTRDTGHRILKRHIAFVSPAEQRDHFARRLSVCVGVSVR